MIVEENMDKDEEGEMKQRNIVEKQGLNAV